MRIFALETDIEKIKERFCHKGECIVLMTYYHGLSFFFAILREICISFILISVGIVGVIFKWPLVWMVPILLVLWLMFVFFNVVKAYIDWTYDFIIITTDKIILVDQTSIIKQQVTPLHIENIGAISMFTQYWNIFPFGGIAIHLKEGRGGEDITLKYVPRAQEVASIMSDVVTQYQRRQYSQDIGSPVPSEGQKGHHRTLDPIQTPIQPPSDQGLGTSS